MTEAYTEQSEYEERAKIVIGNRIRELRRELPKPNGIEKFANQIGMDRSYLSGVENGKRNISFIRLLRILRGLGISPLDFFEGIDIETPL